MLVLSVIVLVFVGVRGLALLSTLDNPQNAYIILITIIAIIGGFAGAGAFAIKEKIKKRKLEKNLDLKSAEKIYEKLRNNPLIKERFPDSDGKVKAFIQNSGEEHAKKLKVEVVRDPITSKKELKVD